MQFLEFGVGILVGLILGAMFPDIPIGIRKYIESRKKKNETNTQENNAER